MVEWFIFIIHGLVYDFIVANLSCCCLEYYIDDEITMLIDDVLGCVGWFLDGDIICAVSCEYSKHMIQTTIITTLYLMFKVIKTSHKF